MNSLVRRLTTLVLVASMLVLVYPTPLRARAQDEYPVAQLMEDMSSAAKVGQLFLVTFPGADIADESVIAGLIRDYHIGGVVLLPENGNIINEGNTPLQVATLSWRLQQVAFNATEPATQTLPGAGPPPGPFVPLFIAASHEGNGAPHTSVVNGMTPLPSAMALGATWDPSYAETMGRIVGQELRSLGINMLLGPSLDVLEIPRPESAGDLGIRTFGGDPFWVGRMGQMYVRGVHEGAEGQVAVVAKHFPGMGSSDRSLDEEISTVQRTLDRLRQVDLAPFAAVAQAADPQAQPDGVMVSHIRFRGLEGGRFVTTRPASVDSQLLQRLLALPELAGWREAGGVTVSDGLGVRALQRFYDPSEQAFNSRRIAQEAFLAGNDVLLLSQFGLTDDWNDQINNVVSTITFFRDKYDSDPSFQTLVDAAVARILRLKLALYDDSFVLSDTQPDALRIGVQLGGHREALAAVARDAITLLSPPTPDLVPAPPTPEDDIVIFVDSREERPCAACQPVPLIAPQALQDTIVRLYGPDTTGQIDPALVSSYSLDDLEEYLDAPVLPEPTPSPEGSDITPALAARVEIALGAADWVIFAMLGPRGDPAPPETVTRFLAERAGALRNPNLVVIAYDAPYYLDATEISKLSAYYVAYGHVDPIIEASVRALFGEFGPTGAPPVSVAGIGYNLVAQVSPDPEQTITLEYAVGEPLEEGEPTPTPESADEGEPTPEPPEIQVGTSLRMRTSAILDHNGNPVPDGTPVQFFFSYPQEGLEQSITAPSREGIAETTLRLERTGQLDIAVQSDPLPRTVVLQITIGEEGPAIIVPITRTPRPTQLPTPTDTPEPSPVPQDTPVPTVTPVEQVEETEPEEPPAAVDDEGPGLADLILALTAAVAVASVGFYLARLTNEMTSRALRTALWCLLGGLVLYTAYLLYTPGAAWLRERSGVWASGWVTLVGGSVPLVITLLLSRLRSPAQH